MAYFPSFILVFSGGKMVTAFGHDRRRTLAEDCLLSPRNDYRSKISGIVCDGK